MEFWCEIFCKFLLLYANLVDQIQLEMFVKIRQKISEIAKNNMNFGGRLSHEFAIFGKNFCIDLLNVVK